jgi:UDPglucose 6-dehydrogenase
LEIAIIGSGYVGLVTGACLAETGHSVTCVDNNSEKVATLRKGRAPFFEPGLAEMLERNIQQGRLIFTDDLGAAVSTARIVFICVGTPSNKDGSANLDAVTTVTRSIAKSLNGYKVIVTKSTVPVGTTDELAKLIASTAKQPSDMVSNPEFLKQGNAIEDCLKPDHIIIGTASTRAADIMRDLYAPFVRTGSPILFTDTRSAEMTKYATNAMLAARISLMNEIANLCELVGADVESVRRGLGADKRIGSSFIFPGVGYGGSCLPKDVKALAHMGKGHGYDLQLCEAIDQVNQRQADLLFKKIERQCGPLKGIHIAVWGLAFKPRTDDLREAPSIRIIRRLIEAGAHVSAHDPQAMGAARQLLGEHVRFTSDSYDTVKDAEALILVTEWNEFRHPDFERVKRLMKKPVIFDGRNIYDSEKLRKMGFVYHGIGKA